MPNASFLTHLVSTNTDAALSNVPRNGNFSDVHGLEFTDDFADGAPFAWSVTNGGVANVPGAGLSLSLDQNGAAATGFGVLTGESFIQIDLRLPGVTAAEHVFDSGGDAKEVVVFADLLVGSTVIATRCRIAVSR